MENAPQWKDYFDKFQQDHRAQFGIGIDRPWNADPEAARAKEIIDAAYLKALEEYNQRTGHAVPPEAGVLGVDAQPNAYTPKPKQGGFLGGLGQWFENNVTQPIQGETGEILGTAALAALGMNYLPGAVPAEGVGAAGATAGDIALSTTPEFAYTDAVANSLNPSMFSAPTISGGAGATYSDAVLAQLTGQGDLMGLNAANVGQTADQIMNARDLQNFIGNSTAGALPRAASYAGGPFAGAGMNIAMGADAMAVAEGLAVGKTVSEIAKQTGIPPQIVAEMASDIKSGSGDYTPSADTLFNTAVSVYNDANRTPAQSTPRPSLAQEVADATATETKQPEQPPAENVFAGFLAPRKKKKSRNVLDEPFDPEQFMEDNPASGLTAAQLDYLSRSGRTSELVPQDNVFAAQGGSIDDLVAYLRG